jgi:arginase
MSIELITAPSNLGLRPPTPGHEPGAWRAPEVLLSAGLATGIDPSRVVELERPPYSFEAQRGTRIRNGLTIREHSLRLAEAVDAALSASRAAIVVGGDCSVLLGCLLGARRGGRCGLVHLDGHADFAHPDTYDPSAVLGAVAGMDLALATGRGEPMLSHWPSVPVPLVGDADVIQIGDREAPDELDATPGGIPLARLTIQEVLRLGIEASAQRALAHLDRRGLDRAWLHVDLDVLDQEVMPAVDSPGSPGLDFEQLAELIERLATSNHVIGVDITIYDPELDDDHRYAPSIVGCLVRGLKPLRAERIER